MFDIIKLILLKSVEPTWLFIDRMTLKVFLKIQVFSEFQYVFPSFRFLIMSATNSSNSNKSSPSESDVECFLKLFSKRSSDESETDTRASSKQVSKPKSKWLSGEEFMKRAIAQSGGPIDDNSGWNSTFLKIHVNNKCFPADELFNVLKFLPEYQTVELFQVVRAIKKCGDCQTREKFPSGDSDRFW